MITLRPTWGEIYRIAPRWVLVCLSGLAGCFVIIADEEQASLPRLVALPVAVRLPSTSTPYHAADSAFVRMTGRNDQADKGSNT